MSSWLVIDLPFSEISLCLRTRIIHQWFLAVKGTGQIVPTWNYHCMFIPAAVGSKNLDLKHNSWGCLIYLFYWSSLAGEIRVGQERYRRLAPFRPGAFFNCVLVFPIEWVCRLCSLLRATGHNYMQILKSVKGFRNFFETWFRFSISVTQRPCFVPRQRGVIICRAKTLSRVLLKTAWVLASSAYVRTNWTIFAAFLGLYSAAFLGSYSKGFPSCFGIREALKYWYYSARKSLWGIEGFMKRMVQNLWKWSLANRTPLGQHGMAKG